MVGVLMSNQRSYERQAPVVIAEVTITKFYSLSEFADSLPLKLSQLPPMKSDFYEPLQGRSSNEYLQIHIKDFRYLQSE